MKIRNNTKLKLFISFFILTFSDALYFYEIGWSNKLNYLGLMLLLLTEFEKFVKMSPNKQAKIILFELMPVLFAFSIGIIMQNMSAFIKIKLVVSMVIIACIALLSDRLLDSLEDIRGASYGILWGIVCTFILSIITGTSIVSRVEEGKFLFGLSMGLRHKNNCGMDLLAAFSGLYICRKNHKRKDRFTLYFLFVLIILSHARIAWGLLVLFMIMMQLDYIKYIGKRYRKIVSKVIYIFFFISCCFGFRYISIHSSTIAIRVRGLINWLNYFHGDIFHIMFGNAALAWADTGYGYVMNVRSTVGMDGTLEMAVLGILVKNGAIGFLGYIIIFRKYIKKICMLNDSTMIKNDMIAVISIALISMLTESFIINLAVVFGSYYFVLIGGTIGFVLNQKARKF